MDNEGSNVFSECEMCVHLVKEGRIKHRKVSQIFHMVQSEAI